MFNTSIVGHGLATLPKEKNSNVKLEDYKSFLRAAIVSVDVRQQPPTIRFV